MTAITAPLTLEDSRQEEIVDREVANSLAVALVGLGTVGSWLVPLLAKLGIRYLSAWDDDEVSLPNTESQSYAEYQVGLPKSLAVQEGAHSSNLPDFHFLPTRVTAKTRPQYFDVVISCVDTWAGRRAVLRWAMLSGSRWFLDARVSARLSSVLACDLMDDGDVERYTHSLGTAKDDRNNARTRRCGLTGTAYVGASTAAHLTALVNNIINGEEVIRESSYSLAFHRQVNLNLTVNNNG